MYRPQAYTPLASESLMRSGGRLMIPILGAFVRLGLGWRETKESGDTQLIVDGWTCATCSAATRAIGAPGYFAAGLTAVMMLWSILHVLRR